MKKTITIPAIIASIIIGYLLALAGSQGSEEFNGLSLFAVCASVSYLMHWLIFIPSYAFQTEHYFDLTGTLSYLSALAVGFYLNPTSDPRDILIGLLITIWAVRLGSFLFLRIKKDGKDKRFTIMKTEFVFFLMTWTIGGLWVFLTMAAGLAAITSNETVPLGMPALAGLTLWIFGFTIEIVADKQKRDFKKDTSQENEFITSGLWAWSRHPNYFGEITLWAGLTLIALPVLSGWQLCTLISPFFVYILLTRISGIPLLENRAIKKWGSDPEYISYLERTPALMMKKPRSN
jgi:steroid 5-alpha reductase family enzyme